MPPDSPDSIRARTSARTAEVKDRLEIALQAWAGFLEDPEDIEGMTSEEAWVYLCTELQRQIAGGIAATTIAISQLTVLNPDRRELLLQRDRLEEASLAFTNGFIEDIAALRPDLDEINGQLAKLIATAKERGNVLDTVSDGVEEVLSYAGLALAIWGAIQAF